jgi:putative ABC transport system substrate-binding protein
MNITRKYLIVICIFMILLLGGCAEKPQEKVFRVGMMSGAEAFIHIADGFKERMNELGYIEGKNIFFDLQDSGPEEVQQVAKKFVEDKVDLIFAFPTEPSVAAKAAAKDTNIPVVFSLAGIEGTDLVESLQHPGDHITGVRFPAPESTVKRLEFLHEIVPDAKRVWIIYDPNYPLAGPSLAMLRPASISLGITLVETPIAGIEDIRQILSDKARSGKIDVDAIFIMPEVLTQTPECFGEIMAFANKHKILIGGAMDYTTDLGAVFNQAPDVIEMGRLAAVLADKIFKGTPAGSIPVVTPELYLRLNYKKAQELGLEVPEGLMALAREIIR